MNRLFYISHRGYFIISRRWKTVMSGIQPTGIPHLGNYFGAIRQWIDLQSNNSIHRIFLSIVDMHAMTPLVKPHNINKNVYQMAASLIACGLSGDKISLFQQSTIPHHTYLSWILMCVCPLSRVQSLPQWKEKLEIWPKDELPNAALMMYPILQAADILLYTPDLVPVGEDQIIHLNLARYLRTKLISWHGDKLTQLDKYIPIPDTKKCQFPKIFSLQQSCKKMSKSDPNIDSRIELTDSPDEIRRKIKRSLTDSVSKKITYDLESRPALANLINVYCSLKDSTPDVAMLEISHLSKSEFKELLAEELVKTIDPIRLKIIDLLDNRDEINRILKCGHDTAFAKATETMKFISSHIGMGTSTLDLTSRCERINVSN